MSARMKPYVVRWPLEPHSVESIDLMFEQLFTDVGALNERVALRTARAVVFRQTPTFAVPDGTAAGPLLWHTEQYTPVPFEQFTQDTHRFWRSQHPDRLVVPDAVAGIYAIFGQAVYAAAAAARRGVGVFVNGQRRAGNDAISFGASNQVSLSAAVTLELPPGAVVQLGVQQTSGSALDILGGDVTLTSLALHRVN